MEIELADTRNRAEYQRTRRQQAVLLYFPTRTDLTHYQDLARSAGYTQFNPWLIQMLVQATSGSTYPPEYVDGLKDDLDRTKSWLESTRDENTEYRKEVKALREQRDRLAQLLSEFPTGVELASRVFGEGLTGGVRA